MFNQSALVRIVRDGLDDAAPKLVASGGWADLICESIEERLRNLDPDIECAFGKKKPEDRREWLFDFIALVCNDADRTRERYLMQALIVGEIESHNNLGKDFEKLMVTDALVCFFAFQGANREHMIDFYRDIAKSRRHHALRRGLNPPPAFILASYTAGKFTYSAVALNRGCARGGPSERSLSGQKQRHATAAL
jgi:hypothetical protein